jgi:adenosylhomocysteine nucleosidase
MRILVTFAVYPEFALWRSRHAFVPYEVDEAGNKREFDLFRANIGANEVTALLTGMGGKNAGDAMRTIPLATFDLCVATGLAGALNPTLGLGDIVVARGSQTVDQKGTAATDLNLVSVAAACGARAVDVFLTSHRILVTAAEKEYLSASGSVVEMETSYILEAARQHRIPLVAVRAISDSLDEDLPVDFNRLLDSRGRLKVSQLFTHVLLQPYRIPPLIRFGRQSRSATRSLADFLDRYIPAIAQNWQPARPSAQEVAAT